MPESKESWEEVERHVSDLGRKVRDHYRKLDTGTGTEGGEVARAERQRLGDALRSLTDQLDQAFTAVGDALRDPEAQQSLNRAVKSFGSAVSSTLSDASDEVRRRLGRHPGSTPPDRRV
jgi:hypothetical protein